MLRAGSATSAPVAARRTRARRRLTAGAIAAPLAAVALAAGGCGESSKPPSAAASGGSATTGQSTSTSPATGATDAGRDERASSDAGARETRSSTTTSAMHHAQSASPIRRRKRARFVLPGPNSRPAPRATPSEQADIAVDDMTLTSPAFNRGGGGAAEPGVASQYTCHGSDASPPLEWGGVPAGTQELALFVLSMKPVDNKLFFDWAVAGLPGSLRRLPAGALPAGASVGRNGAGRDSYTLCPPGGAPESYVFTLYALPERLSPPTGFDPAALRARVMTLARHSGLLIASEG